MIPQRRAEAARLCVEASVCGGGTGAGQVDARVEGEREDEEEEDHEDGERAVGSRK